MLFLTLSLSGCSAWGFRDAQAAVSGVFSVDDFLNLAAAALTLA